MTIVASRKIENVHPVDRLGEIRAQIADLKVIEAPLVAEIKSFGIGTFDGDLFVGRVSDVPASLGYDVAALEKKFVSLGGVLHPPLEDRLRALMKAKSRDGRVDERFFTRHTIVTRNASVRLTLKDRK